jgi:hypothetical protein
LDEEPELDPESAVHGRRSNVGIGESNPSGDGGCSQLVWCKESGRGEEAQVRWSHKVGTCLMRVDGCQN